MKAKDVGRRTRAAIEAQLLTNTGASMLDSGGAYGRHHERNREKGVKFGEGTRADKWGFTIPVHDFLYAVCERTDECVKMEKQLLKRARKIDPEADLCYHDRDAVETALKQLGATGVDKWVNTYNSECDLSQTLQFLRFDVGRKCYALIQVHQGCDVRGGYTDATLYEVDPDYLYRWTVELENLDRNYSLSAYEAEEEGAAWDEEAQAWKWPGGELVEYRSTADGY